MGKAQDVQSWIEKHFTIYLFCHKYLCPSIYKGRKCQSEAARNIQTKGVTSGGFCEMNVAKRRKQIFFLPDFLPTLSPVHLLARI